METASWLRHTCGAAGDLQYGCNGAQLRSGAGVGVPFWAAKKREKCQAEHELSELSVTIML